MNLKTVLGKVSRKRTLSLSVGLFLTLLVAVVVNAQSYWGEVDFMADGKINSMDIVEMFKFFGCPYNCPITEPTPTPLPPGQWTDCGSSPLGASLQGIWQVCDDCHSGPTIVNLSQQGYSGLVGSLNCGDQQIYYDDISDANWTKVSICNSLECLCGRVTSDTSDNFCQSLHPGYPPPSDLPWDVGGTACESGESAGFWDIDNLSYGPERLGGVPDQEKYNLPWATERARDIAHANNKPLQISYGTEQLHIEASERPECGDGVNGDWDNIECVVDILAPYGDVWMIQAADEYNSNFNNIGHDGYLKPILSQMHFDLSEGEGPAWRAEADRWSTAIKSANPNIQVWIQLALHRIGPPEDAPSAELLLEYREWLVGPQHGAPVVDAVYISSVYSYPTVAGWEVAEEELANSFYYACGGQGPTPTPQPTLPPGTTPTPTPTQTPIPTLPPGSGQFSSIPVEEGWTQDKAITGLTLEGGYYYRIFEHSTYTCGDGGPYQVIVFDSSDLEVAENKNLFVKFPGGGIGFFYYDNSGERVYFTNPNAVGVHTSSYAYNTFFRTGVSQEFANGLTKRIRENNVKGAKNARLAVVSYCSHDFYHGRGEDHEDIYIDGFHRYGYYANSQALDFIQSYFNTNKTVTFGGSSGAANFFVAKDQNDVAGMVMDSQAGDLSALSEACENGISVHGPGEACFCPEGGPQCHAEFADRVGFTLGMENLSEGDEPYLQIQRGEVNIPIYLVWNQYDASRYAYLEYERLHNAILTHNPGGSSVANMVCITNPNSPPGPSCNLHVPTAYDYNEGDYLGDADQYDTTTSEQLVTDVYNWMMERVGDQQYTIQRNYAR